MECGDIIYRSTLQKSQGITVTIPERLFRPTYKKEDIVLGKKLGEGSFGVVYRASLPKKSSSKDGDIDVKMATEYGAVEIWMNERVCEELVLIAVLIFCMAFSRVLRRKDLNIG